jgi:hypothetical protein
MSTLASKHHHDGTVAVNGIAVKIQEIWHSFMGWWHTPIDARHSTHENFPTIILTDTREKIYSPRQSGVRLHSYRDILEVEKPTWAQWRAQLNHMKKAHHSPAKRTRIHVDMIR